MRSNRKRHLANKADNKDNKADYKLDDNLSAHNRFDHRHSASLICSPARCCTSLVDAVDRHPVDTRPVDKRSFDISPVDISPVDTRPVHTSPIDNAPVNQPVDNRPFNNRLVDHGPFDNRPVHNPVGSCPFDNRLVDSRLFDNRPVDNNHADNNPVNLPPSVQCNPLANSSSSSIAFGNRNSSSSSIRSSVSHRANRANPQPSASSGLACGHSSRRSSPCPIHSLPSSSSIDGRPSIQRTTTGSSFSSSNYPSYYPSYYSSSLRSPPAKRRKTDQLPPAKSSQLSLQRSPLQQSSLQSPLRQSSPRSPLRPSPRSPLQQSSLRQSPLQRSPLQQSPGINSPAATRLDNKRNERIFPRCVEAVRGRPTGTSSAAQPSALPAGDKENNSNNFRVHESDTRSKRRDKTADHQSRKVSSHKSEVSRNLSDGIRKNDDSNLEDDPRAVNDHTASDNSSDILQSKSSKQPKSSNESTVARVRRFLTSSGAVDDPEYWRLRCAALTEELKRALDELDALENENELLSLELSELRRQSKVSGKLKKLLQMLGL